MLRILKNKRGLLGNIGGFIAGLFQSITTIMPKPVLFALFLIFLLFLGNMLSYAFYLGGIFCNPSDEPVKIEGNLLSNIDLMGEIPTLEIINQEAISTNPSSNALIVSCVFEAKNANITILKSNTQQQLTLNQLQAGDTIQITNTPTYFFKGISCVDCLKVEIDEYDGIDTRFQACLGDANRLTDTEKGWWARQFCDSSGLEKDAYCDIPVGYRYESSNGLFVCSDNTCQGTGADIWNEKLEARNAHLLYPEITTGRKKSSNDAVGIICSDLQPKIGLYGINIFSYTLWIFLALLAVMLWAYTNIK